MSLDFSATVGKAMRDFASGIAKLDRERTRDRILDLIGPDGEGIVQYNCAFGPNGDAVLRITVSPYKACEEPAPDSDGEEIAQEDAAWMAVLAEHEEAQEQPPYERVVWDQSRPLSGSEMDCAREAVEEFRRLVKGSAWSISVRRPIDRLQSYVTVSVGRRLGGGELPYVDARDVSVVQNKDCIRRDMRLAGRELAIAANDALRGVIV
ncbi:MAG: hypothetical protein KGL39_22070 [Patescibacteria group bacterium]|nr:hypothetical protein [Patescibacteria group bacterium]